MKTTIEIPDALLAAAKRIAARERTTVRALVEEGLRNVLAGRSKSPAGFRLRKASVKGQGLQPDVASAGWAEIRERIYEGRGA